MYGIVHGSVYGSVHGSAFAVLVLPRAAWLLASCTTALPVVPNGRFGNVLVGWPHGQAHAMHGISVLDPRCVPWCMLNFAITKMLVTARLCWVSRVQEIKLEELRARGNHFGHDFL